MSPRAFLSAVFTTILAASCAAAPLAAPETLAGTEPRTRNIFVFLGDRSLDEDEWFPVDEQDGVVGFTASMVGTDAPIGFEMDGFYGSDTENGFVAPGEGPVDERSKVGEYFFGAVLMIHTGLPFRPYAGVGGSMMYAEAREGPSGDSSSDEDQTFGAYVHGGLILDISSRWMIAFDARTVFATDLYLFGRHTDADYTQLSLGVGFGF